MTKKGAKFSTEHKLHMSLSHTGVKLSAYHRQQVSNSLKGKQHSPERIGKRTFSFKGRKMSAEFCQKMSLALTGRKLTEEHKQKISFALKGEKSYWFGKMKVCPKSIYCNDLGHLTRSTWETKCFRILKQRNIAYQYEIKTFRIYVNNILTTYTPDAKLNDNTFLEIKGWLKSEALQKMLAFKEQYPQHKLIVITVPNNFAKLDFCYRLINYFEFIKNNINRQPLLE